MGMRLCFPLREFFSSDYFNSIIDVSGRGVDGQSRGLYILPREFSILDNFKSIADGSCRGVFGGSRSLFSLSSKFLLSWLVSQYVTTLPNDLIRLILSFEEDIGDFCIDLMDPMGMFYLPFPYP